MKICILTQPLGANYGGILQAYALQQTLRSSGHDVTTLRFRPEVPWVPSGYKKHLLTLRRFISKYVKGNSDIIYCSPDRQTRYAYRELDRFIDTRMNCLEVSAPLSVKNLPEFDAYIVGSDQVWRPSYSPFLPDFYLDFLGDTPAKRIAYAASFGVDTWEADEEMTARIRPLAQRFDAISVREASGVKLCAEHLDVHAEVMPDPTFLLTAADYYDLCETRQTSENNYIAVYLLDKGEREQHLINLISAQSGLPIKNTGLLDWARSTDSLENWISAIAGARFVITNSFHGTVFSLLFEKNFLTIKNSQRGTARFASLLNSLGLQSRLLDLSAPNAEIPEMLEIDYQVVKEKLNSMRQLGRSFLQDSLQ